MRSDTETPRAAARITRVALQALIDALIARGYAVIGPTVRDGAIVYDQLSTTAELPAGWTDEQAPGRYRLQRRDDDALFGFAVGPHSWKRYLHPPMETLWTARSSADGFDFSAAPSPTEKYAFLGVRACELQAIAIQDRVFQHDRFRDTAYAARRDNALIVAVHCAQPASTCFCSSMQSGPKARGAFDLALTELLDAERHDFLVEVGSPAGAELLDSLAAAEATRADLDAADAVIAQAERRMGRTIDSSVFRERLRDRAEHPRWTEVADRCLSCGNCTMVCPTCFCTTVEDHTDLSGAQAERVRKWDSCFTMEFSYIHGGSVRQSTGARYRQWMTHKLSSWVDQFGSSGCVGCGRCIAWCPVGIDIAAEATAICADTPPTPGATP
ncbi:sulfite reductase subunit A [Sinimarinibacterium sp. CAU 1509]|uniref:4Fe-4S dicluster domain-containing protein n=1 Tax=Sinimarinibacterium sp. CAU 1509 TaxID=2562283 RepID=UPI0010AC6381|nr:4Fe-4S dicluster domain-containing protein [Sinimarinibacterium sp. CAU 1509]TJY59290.1 sulfite reductase subunit A [Sinimarinibacterium sp. CAU 1509]